MEDTNLQIYRHNTELFTLITKLKCSTQHDLIYYEINNENYQYNKWLIARQLSILILKPKTSQNLIFIETNKNSYNVTKEEKTVNNFLSQFNEHLKEVT